MNQQETDALREYLRDDTSKARATAPLWRRLDWLNVLTWTIVALAGVAFWAIILGYAVGALTP